MVEDGYEAHPCTGFIYMNGPDGAKGIYVKKKDFDSSKKKLVWMDAPGLPFQKGAPISAGSKHMFIHVWLVPDKDKCERYFTIEIDHDASGKITKNKLTILK
jgi:hypothetical protein